MEVDAFTAGVEPGGLNSTRDIKILCCYLLHYVNQPVRHEQLVEALTVTGLVNYFEVASAISELLMLGNIVQDENGYSLTASGLEISNALGNDLPLSVREKASLELKDFIDFESKSKQIDVQIDEVDNFYKVTCTLKDDYSIDLYSISLTVPDRKTAILIRRNFISKSEELYKITTENLIGETF